MKVTDEGDGDAADVCADNGDWVEGQRWRWDGKGFERCTFLALGMLPASLPPSFGLERRMKSSLALAAAFPSLEAGRVDEVTP